jgi:hypothetical protein
MNFRIQFIKTIRNREKQLALFFKNSVQHIKVMMNEIQICYKNYAKNILK